MPSEFAIHSDLLVHWTGRDIDEEHQPDWPNEDQTEINSEAVGAYLRRLRDILTYGLWMTQQPGWKAPSGVDVPSVSGICFTELKLSQSRAHARKYGRLGIAVKRPFVIGRGGRPVVYYFDAKDAFIGLVSGSLQDKRLLQFIKPMDSGVNKRLVYDYYSESEWRIVSTSVEHVPRTIIDPRETKDPMIADYFASLPAQSQEKLRHLVPLDAWHAAIIYPALAVKNAAQEEDSEIPQLIRKIAKEGHGNRVEGLNLPVEIDLDLCRNL